MYWGMVVGVSANVGVRLVVVGVSGGEVGLGVGGEIVEVSAGVWGMPVAVAVGDKVSGWGTLEEHAARSMTIPTESRVSRVRLPKPDTVPFNL